MIRLHIMSSGLLLLIMTAPLFGQNPSVVEYWDDIHEQGMQWTLSGTNVTTPGDVSTPYPTIQNLAVEWKIAGDDDLNCSVAVRFRAAGTAAWREAMPLRRVPGMRYDVGAEKHFFRWPNKMSGSILDLDPDTEYEINMQLKDPDGGEAEKTVRVRTRPVPGDMPNAPVKTVTPQTFAREMANARPGDVFLLAPGQYGYFAAMKDGEPGKPIVIRADPNDFIERNLAPGQEGHHSYVVFNGVSLHRRKYVHLEGILSRNTIDLFNAENCAVMRCIVQDVWGIVSSEQGLERWLPEVYGRIQPPPNNQLFFERDTPRKEIPPHMRNCYIAENVVIGAIPWWSSTHHNEGKNLGEGIQISGPGNVVCNNTVIGFRDCISIMEDRYAWEQRCIDVYNNDIYSGADDGIEVDYIFDNCRIMRNRITNCMRGIAVAPSLGGPAYLIRNVLYNTEGTWQLGRMGSGYVVLHNTSVKSGRGVSIENATHAMVHNNLFICGGERAGAVSSRSRTRAYIDYDYNGYGVIGAPFTGNIDGSEFTSEQELRTKTMERHGVQVDLGIFAAPVAIPEQQFPGYAPPDLRLKPSSKAVDAAQVIPNVNDGYAGAAPDLGAYEAGAPLPVYGVPEALVQGHQR